jgi:spore germination protein D
MRSIFPKYSPIYFPISKIKISAAYVIAALVLVVMLGGCSSSEGEEKGQANYQDIKQMITDSLGSKEGRDAISEVLRDPSIKDQIIIEDTDVKKAVADSILDPQNKKILEDTIKDPKFAAEFAKNVQKEHEKLLKSLLKDPEYRELLIEVLKEPDFESILLDLLTGSAMRKQMQEAAKEAFTTPAARLELMELLRKIQQEELEIKLSEGGQKGGGEEEGKESDSKTEGSEDSEEESSGGGEKSSNK